MQQQLQTSLLGDYVETIMELTRGDSARGISSCERCSGRVKELSRYRSERSSPFPLRLDDFERRSLGHLLRASTGCLPKSGGLHSFHLTIAPIHWVDAVHQTRIRTSSQPASSHPPPRAIDSDLRRAPVARNPSQISHLARHLRLAAACPLEKCSSAPPSFLPPRASKTSLAWIPGLLKLGPSVAIPFAAQRHSCAIPLLHTTATIPS